MITYKYSHSGFDSPNEVKHQECVMEIPEDLLVKPEDLHKHVGEVLLFHNGYGYVVSGILTSAKDVPMNQYSFRKDIEFDYTHELDMSYFYHKDLCSKYFTIQFAYVVSVDGIIHDEVIYNPLYVSIPTKEELEFRNYWLSVDKDSLTKEYDRLKEIVDKIDN